MESVGKVGIFFFVENQWLIEAVPVAQAEAYGDSLSHGGHYEFWEKLRPGDSVERRFKSRVYDAYPRGRAVFFPRRKQFVVYADACFGHKRLLEIADQFGIAETEVVFSRDEHYQCAACNPDFTE